MLSSLYVCSRGNLSKPQLIRQASTSIRRNLSPFVKLIHPDLFSSSTADVKNANLKFLQSLNELADTAQTMVDTLERRGSLDVTKPLPTSYSFVFYVKEKVTSEAESSDGNETNVRRIAKSFRTPMHLSSRQSLGHSTASSAIDRLLINIGDLLVSAGLRNPWYDGNSNTDADTEEVEEIPQTRKRRSRTMDQQSEWVARAGFAKRTTTSSRAASENLMKQQEKMALERLQEHAAERDSLARWGKRDNHSRLASIFNSHSNSSRGHRGSMTEREAVTLLEVDRFISNGNVMVRGSPSPSKELEVLGKLRKFMIEFGPLLNFTFRGWSKVIVIIDGSTISGGGSASKQPYLVEYITYESNDDGLSIISGSSDNAKSKDGTDDIGKSSSRKLRRRPIITIPFGFKYSRLYKHLLENVEQSHFASPPEEMIF